jgi:hypothetical protein
MNPSWSSEGSCLCLRSTWAQVPCQGTGAWGASPGKRCRHYGVRREVVAGCSSSWEWFGWQLVWLSPRVSRSQVGPEVQLECLGWIVGEISQKFSASCSIESWGCVGAASSSSWVRWR